MLATVYLLGEVFGALFFGRLSDALGRRNLFVLTLGVYLFGNALTAFAWDDSAGSMAFIYLTRFIAGAGIGGEYAAINSAIDEMMPAKYAGGSISASTGPTGAARSSARSRRSSSSTSLPTTSAGASASSSVRSSVWPSGVCAVTCPRALGGC